MLLQANTISPLEPVSGSGIGGFFGGLLNVLDKGAEVYLGTQERIQALKQIKSETVNSPASIVAAPGTATETILLAQAKTSLQRGSIALIIAGILGIILLLAVLKRRR